MSESHSKKFIDLKNFILTGQIGVFNGGETKEQIEEYFGEPENFTPDRKSYPTFMVYGGLEFRLRNNKLESVSLSLMPNVLELNDIKIKCKMSSEELNFENIEGMLQEMSINWKVNNAFETFSTQKNIVTEKNIELVFDTESGGKLVKVNASYCFDLYKIC